MDKRTKRKVGKLIKIRKKRAGRDSQGRISVRHKGGEGKRFIRRVDWKRDKVGVLAKVEAVEYDPNRTARLALLLYQDGERRFILCPEGLKVGDQVIADEKTAVKTGNAMLIEHIPAGVPIHSLEIVPGKGAQMVKSAGTAAFVQSKEGANVVVKLPSGETRVFNKKVRVVVGQVGNVAWNTVKLKKAGDSRHRGVRPTVRGVAQHPGSHPHGGGEGKSPIGMKSPKSPWGKKTLGKRTRKRRKYSDRLIIKKRGKKR